MRRGLSRTAAAPQPYWTRPPPHRAEGTRHRNEPLDLRAADEALAVRLFHHEAHPGQGQLLDLQDQPTKLPDYTRRPLLACAWQMMLYESSRLTSETPNRVGTLIQIGRAHV